MGSGATFQGTVKKQNSKSVPKLQLILKPILHYLLANEESRTKMWILSSRATECFDRSKEPLIEVNFLVLESMNLKL